MSFDFVIFTSLNMSNTSFSYIQVKLLSLSRDNSCHKNAYTCLTTQLETNAFYAFLLSKIFEGFERPII